MDNNFAALSLTDELPGKIYINANGNLLIKMYWSDNGPDDPSCDASIGVDMYDAEGNEVDGGVLDVLDKGDDLRLYIEDVFQNIVDRPVMSYALITEEDFEKVVDKDEPFDI